MENIFVILENKINVMQDKIEEFINISLNPAIESTKAKLPSGSVARKDKLAYLNDLTKKFEAMIDKIQRTTNNRLDLHEEFKFLIDQPYDNCKQKIEAIEEFNNQLEPLKDDLIQLDQSFKQQFVGFIQFKDGSDMLIDFQSALKSLAIDMPNVIQSIKLFEDPIKEFDSFIQQSIVDNINYEESVSIKLNEIIKKCYKKYNKLGKNANEVNQAYEEINQSKEEIIMNYQDQFSLNEQFNKVIDLVGKRDLCKEKFLKLKKILTDLKQELGDMYIGTIQISLNQKIQKLKHEVNDIIVKISTKYQSISAELLEQTTRGSEKYHYQNQFENLKKALQILQEDNDQFGQELSTLQSIKDSSISILSRFVQKQKETCIRLLKTDGEITQLNLQLFQEKIMRKQDNIDMMLIHISSQLDFLGPQELVKLRAQKLRQKQSDVKYEEINKKYLSIPFNSEDEDQNLIVLSKIVTDMQKALQLSNNVLDEYKSILRSLKLLKIQQLHEERIEAFNDEASERGRAASGSITPEKEIIVANEAYNQMSNIKPKIQSQNVSRTRSPIYQSLIKSFKQQTDETDLLINEFIQANNVAMPITKIQANVYQFGSRKVTTKVNNGVLLVRVGGGYMSMANFYFQYGETSHVKLMRQDKSTTKTSISGLPGNSFIRQTTKTSLGTASPSFHTTLQHGTLKKLNIAASPIKNPKIPILQTNLLTGRRTQLAQKYETQHYSDINSNNSNGKVLRRVIQSYTPRISPSRVDLDSDILMSQVFPLETITSRLDTSFENSVDDSQQSFNSQQQIYQSGMTKQIHQNGQSKRLQKKHKSRKL
ncbi:viral a-type inclusion protein repeat containing protein [Stylonychia lemnae]|uniref:Viral a-type inclusion protein repeat containing protein n=1 Tax=Stylonychia lemnae TaxID=5949 RepID=A0A078A2S7_STYLE|nr:viral a-type inclusion protein repeat containing protein [Stylonychia lemnae]|eukprot:CDW75813.1 viral a-type inclusion protein repeat containing protein [Stylonychia lemnae]